MGADDVVVAGGQVVGLHQLRGQKGVTSFWVVPPPLPAGTSRPGTPAHRAIPSRGNNPESASRRAIAAGTAASFHLQTED